MTSISSVGRLGSKGFSTLLAFGTLAGTTAAMAEDAVNSCPVDGCLVEIVSAEIVDGEVNVVFDANFEPGMSKNHLHVWWGELYDVEQVSGNAESFYGVKQGIWHPTDSYPDYTTTGVISMVERGDAVTLCVTASGRTHDILDPNLVSCKSIADMLN